jgi:peptidoglycan/LPS O-acetylase OafA/YrhL
MGATLVAGWFLYLPEDYHLIGKSVIAQVFIISNIFFWRHTGYFAAAVDTKPLLHTWSLSAEEQFYLIFPVILIVISRWRQAVIPHVILYICLGSFCLSIVGSYTSPSATFYLLPTRAWEMMIGAYLATISQKQSIKPWVHKTLSLAGLALILFSVFAYTPETRFPGLAALLPCLGAAAIIYAGSLKTSFVGVLLSWKPVVFVGLISYSLYLWHWPLLVFSKYHSIDEQSIEFRIFLLFACMCLAILSWRYVETPFRKRLIFKDRAKIFWFAAATMAMLLGVGALVFNRQGFTSRLPEKALRFANSRNDRAFRNEISVEQALSGQFIKIGSDVANQPVSVLIWGDSHAMAVTSALDDACRQLGLSGVQATHSATAPLLEYSGHDPFGLQSDTLIFSKAVIEYIAQQKIKAVFITALWSNYGPPDLLADKLSLTVQKIMDSGAAVYLIKDVPNPGFDVPRHAALTIFHQSNPEKLEITKEKYQQRNGDLEAMFEDISKLGVKILDAPGYFLNNSGRYDVIRDDKVLYFDSHHLSVAGAELLIPMLESILSRNLAKSNPPKLQELDQFVEP